MHDQRKEGNRLGEGHRRREQEGVEGSDGVKHAWSLDSLLWCPGAESL